MNGGRWQAVAALLVLVVPFTSLLGSSQDDPSLSGDWSLSVTIDPSDPLAMDASSSLDLTYSVGGWDLSSSSTIGKTGWSKQSFKAGGSLGEITLSSSLDLKTDGLFGSWKTSISWDFEEMSFSGSFNVTPNYVSFSLSTDVDMDPLSLGFDLELRSRGGCGLLFNGLDLSFDFPFCCAEVSGSLSIDCDGFDELEFSVSDIEIPKLVWMTVDADLTFEMDEKELDLSPSFDFGTFGCIDLYVQAQTPSMLVISSFEVYGIGMQCEIGEWTFEALSYVDGTHKLNGDYWEMYALSFDNDADFCGLTSMEVKFYFLAGGLQLFDVALFEGSFDLALNDRFTFDFGMTFDIEAGILEELTLGFDVSW